MLKKVCILIWEILGNLQLTVYLLISLAILFFIGAFYSYLDYSLLADLNEMRLQDWIKSNLITELKRTWWLPLLIIVLVFLGINTFICALNRIQSLIKQRNRMSLYHFFFNLTPSIIHCLFLIVLLGHAITFTLGSWHRIPLKKGEQIIISGQYPILIVDSIESEYYPESSNMHDRIRQTKVELKSKDGNIFQVSFLNYLYYNGYHLHLDMNKKRQVGKKNKKLKAGINESETCNKAHIFHVSNPMGPKTQKLFLLVTKDPGLYIIIISLVFILILMLWYFLEFNRRKGSAT
ncbi:MAG: hypothetical protein SVR08_16595 [Spirochaetota bacterium]|nr:hypothetical protein [Spirochaetota bacterium]